MARTRLLGLSLSAAAVLLMAAATQAFAAPPTVTSISPSSGSTSGQTLFCPSLTSTAITGTNFTGATSATIGGTQATGFLVIDDSHIRVCVPATQVSGVADVTVTSPGGTGVGTGLYTYFSGSPSISIVSPNTGLTTGGNQVFITGSNFIPGTGAGNTPATTVSVNSVLVDPLKVQVTSTGSLTVIMPAGVAGSATITICTAGGVAGCASAGYIYIAPALPTVTSISPSGGSIPSGSVLGGISVTI